MGRFRSGRATGWTSGAGALAMGPSLDAEAPEADEAGRVLVTEGVLGVVGRERVVVQAVRAAPARDRAAAGLQPQAYVTRDEPLAGLDERVERLLQRAE